MIRVLVIGASGLLGSHIVTQLQAKAEVLEASATRGPLKVDISSPESLRALFEKTGPLDAIVCVASPSI